MSGEPNPKQWWEWSPPVRFDSNDLAFMDYCGHKRALALALQGKQRILCSGFLRKKSSCQGWKTSGEHSSHTEGCYFVCQLLWLIWKRPRWAGSELWHQVSYLISTCVSGSVEIFSHMRQLSKRFQNSYVEYSFGLPNFHITDAHNAGNILSDPKLITKSMIYGFLQPFLRTGVLTAAGKIIILVYCDIGYFLLFLLQKINGTRGEICSLEPFILIY